jgi:hypothetical protein
VTLFWAAKRAGRTLVIDLYTADVLDRIAEGTGLPRAGFPNFKVVVTRVLGSSYQMPSSGSAKTGDSRFERSRMFIRGRYLPKGSAVAVSTSS